MTAAGEDRSRFRHALRRTARQIVFDDVPWLVYLLPPALYDRCPIASLIFENETTMRRVRNFPANWRALGDDELFAISWNT
jgi:hypothetical protein